MTSSINRTLSGRLAGCIEPFKGLLILAVVMDHNDVAHALFPAMFRPLTFHVLGFLLLPFLMPPTRFAWPFVRDRATRYLVPFIWVMTLSSFLFWLVYGRTEPAWREILTYVLAVAIGSAPLVKAASGFLAYWFLPALLGMVVLLGVYESLPTVSRRVMIALFVTLHCGLVAQTFGGYYWVPFGLAIDANVFALGLLLRSISRSQAIWRWRVLLPAAFALSYGWLVNRSSWLEVMILQLAPVTTPVTFIVQDIAALTGIGTTILIAHGLRSSKCLASIGRHSLMIYLLHPLAYIGAGIAVRASGLTADAPARAVSLGLLSYAIALVVSWVTAVLLARSRPLAAWITPRDWAHWVPVTMATGSATAARSVQG